ncbi:MAG: S-methyl-5'-thioadenosine phosphorylase [Eubacteriales bacterium]|nr:S-methyl-5'-thioadenosine phosphorylase [Eubacteriales bacterium]
MELYKADIGIFGGSGFYTLFKNAAEIDINTPYGKPSDKITLAEFAGKRVAFLPRHGMKHQFPPHMIPYRANIYAMKEIGVTKLLAPSASGSLRPEIKPGDFVITDQFIDRTSGRKDTFYDGPETKHISAAFPYCPYLSGLALEACRKNGISVHDRGTVVVIQGPRFSTKAESIWFSSMGWDTINMTQYPECMLAREAGICYSNISLITDYDAGLEGHPEIAPVTEDEVLRVFENNNEKLKSVLREIVANIEIEGDHCQCGK